MISKLIEDLSSDPFNPSLNFNIAVEYEKLGQTASAVSFYLRSAEYGINGDNPLIPYTALLRMAHCFEDQNDRAHTVSNALLQALAWHPERPEAYFLMAQFHERSSNWQECYTWAKLGMLYAFDPVDPLPAEVGYHGLYCLEFENAVSAWWIGRRDESWYLLTKLKDMKNITPEYAAAVAANVARINPDAAI